MEYKIFVSRLAIEKAVFHCQTSLAHKPPVEKGGFLLAKKLAGGRMKFIDSIHSPHAEASPAQMIFTHDDWEFAEAYLNSMYEQEDVNIYGWYHSHPGYGVFLSQRDQFIVNSFFDKPWNLALVIDPIERRLGFFVRAAGRIKLLRELEYGILLKKVVDRKDRVGN